MCSFARCLALALSAISKCLRSLKHAQRSWYQLARSTGGIARFGDLEALAWSLTADRRNHQQTLVDQVAQAVVASSEYLIVPGNSVKSLTEQGR